MALPTNAKSVVSYISGRWWIVIGGVPVLGFKTKAAADALHENYADWHASNSPKLKDVIPWVATNSSID